jgi:hypothetical protein
MLRSTSKHRVPAPARAAGAHTQQLRVGVGGEMSACCFTSLLMAASAVAAGGRTDGVAGGYNAAAVAAVAPAAPIAQLVESMPTGLEEVLPRLDGVGDTSSAQIALLDAAQQTVDVTVMYWNLLAASGSGDPAKLHELGADRGAKLYAAFEAAAARGVDIRILQCRGVSLCSDTEATRLQSRFPRQVSVRYWNATDWYDGGIMHQKLWIGDQSHVYRTYVRPRVFKRPCDALQCLTWYVPVPACSWQCEHGLAIAYSGQGAGCSGTAQPDGRRRRDVRTLSHQLQLILSTWYPLALTTQFGTL